MAGQHRAAREAAAIVAAEVPRMALPAGDDELVLLHDPRCSKSRAAHALLAERGVAFRERRYLEDPLSPAELAELAARLGRPPREWARRGEPDWTLDDGAGDAEVLAAMAAHPILIERPILVRGRRAVVGRPPERVLELL
jgi:arsenate reductase